MGTIETGGAQQSQQAALATDRVGFRTSLLRTKLELKKRQEGERAGRLPTSRKLIAW